MNGSLKTVVFWIVILVSAVLLWNVLSRPRSTQTPEITYSTFIAKAQSAEIARVKIAGIRIEGEYRNGQGKFHLVGPSNSAAFLGILQDKGVEIQFRDAQELNSLQLLGTWAPLLLLAALWFFMVRQIRRGKPPNSPGGGFDASGGLR